MALHIFRTNTTKQDTKSQQKSDFTHCQRNGSILYIIESLYVNRRMGGIFYAMAVINLSFDNGKNHTLIAIGEQNVRFITAKSLTQTSQRIQTRVKQHLHETFVLRKPNFEKSIKVQPATKQNLQSETYTMAGFATLQQTGGHRVAKNGRLAVPQYNDLQQLKANRRTDVPGAFVMKLRNGSRVIAHRNNTQIQILYHIKDFARIPKRLQMLELGTQIATTEFKPIFDENLRHIAL